MGKQRESCVDYARADHFWDMARWVAELNAVFNIF